VLADDETIELVEADGRRCVNRYMFELDLEAGTIRRL